MTLDPGFWMTSLCISFVSEAVQLEKPGFEGSHSTHHWF